MKNWFNKLAKYLFTVAKYLFTVFPSTHPSYPGKYNNWVLRNFFNVLALPITFLAIVLSLYQASFQHAMENTESHSPDKREVSVVNYFKWGYYVSILEEQWTLKSNDPKKTIICTPSKRADADIYFVIDRTLSTQGLNEGSFSGLKKALKAELSDNFKKSIPKDFSLKKYIWLSFLDQLFSKPLTENWPDLHLKIAFYDGSTRNSFSILGQTKEQNGWIAINDEDGSRVKNLGFVVDTLKNLSLDTGDKKQYTSLKDIFTWAVNDINGRGNQQAEQHVEQNKRGKRPVILIVVSDFIDETEPPMTENFDDLMADLCDELQRDENIVKVGLIHLIANSGKDLREAKNFLSLFSKRVLSDKVFVQGVNFEEYRNIAEGQRKLNNRKLTRIKRIIPTFLSFDDSIHSVRAYFPIFDFIGSSMYEMRFGARDSFFERGDSAAIAYWRITSPFPFSYVLDTMREAKAFYRVIGNSKRASGWVTFYINQPDELVIKRGEQIAVKFPKTLLKNDMYLSLSSESASKHATFKVIPFPILPKHALIVGLASLYFIAIFWIFSEISLLLRAYHFLKHCCCSDDLFKYVLFKEYVKYACFLGFSFFVFCPWSFELSFFAEILSYIIFILFALSLILLPLWYPMRLKG